jgi:putative transcriptional regulator
VEPKNFDALLSGLGDALEFAKGEAAPGVRVHRVEVDRGFIAEARIKAGLTQEEFAIAIGASLGTVRKWERGERSPSGAARMLVRIMARAPNLVLEEAGLRRRAIGRRRRAGA